MARRKKKKTGAASTVDLSFLKQLDRFRMLLKKKVSSQYQGLRETTAQGSGLTFKDYKAYVPGDDFRNIDWKVFGRTDKFFIRRFEEERNVTVHIILDRSTSMDFGEPRKYDFAVLLGIGFAYLAMKNNEKFEFSTFAEELHPVRARRGTKQLALLLDKLQEAKVVGKSKFTESLESAKSLIKSKSVIVLISDFLYDLDEIGETLLRFKNSEVLCLQVLDRVERDFAVDGDVILRDAEEGVEFRTFVSRRVKHNYRDLLDQHNASIKKLCDQLKNGFVSVTTDEEVFDAFYKAYIALTR